MRRYWRIVPDPEDYEYIQSPTLQLELARKHGEFRGDCDDAATLAGAVMLAARWPCSFIASRDNGHYEFSHVWLRCALGPDLFQRDSFFDIDPFVSRAMLPLVGYAELMEVPVFP